MSAKVLIIDDDKPLAKVTNLVFLRKGFVARSVNSGMEGIKLAEYWDPDTILLDLMMPEMNGIEVCRKLRENENTAHIPIIVVSALDSIEDKVRAFEAGADDYIVKPYENDELVARVNSQLRRFSPIDQQDTQDQGGEIITLFSLKGGAGCSSLAINIAVGLNRMWGASIPLVDLVTPLGSLDLMLNVRPRINLGDIVSALRSEEFSEEILYEALIQHETGVLLLGGVTDPEMAELLTEQHVIAILGYLKNYYPYVIVDTAHNYSPSTLAALDMSDRILIPIAPDISSVRVTHSMLSTFEQLKYPEDKIQILPNWTFAANGLSRGQIERALKQPVLEPILHQGDWVSAINRGQPFILGNHNRTVVQLEDLVWHLSHQNHETQPEDPSPMWLRVASRHNGADI